MDDRSIARFSCIIKFIKKNIDLNLVYKMNINDDSLRLKMTYLQGLLQLINPFPSPTI
jgi:hypothetical protein